MQAQKKELSFRPESFVLCERSSGAIRFRVEADPDGGMPVEQVAGLLAMHCLVRGQAPEDFEVMVVAREALFHAVAERAEQLLAAGRAIGSGVKISRREQEVLDGVLQSLGNKEIASRTQRIGAHRKIPRIFSLGQVWSHRSNRVEPGSISRAHADRDAAAADSNPHFVWLSDSTPGRTVQDPQAEDPPAVAVEVPRARNRVFSMFPRERFAT